MKRVLIVLALGAGSCYHSLNAEYKSANNIPASNAVDVRLFEIVQGEDVIADTINSQINNDLNPNQKEPVLIRDLSLAEYSTSMINKIAVGQSFSVRINGSIGQDVKLTFDKNGYFSEGVKDDVPNKKLGASVSCHYTALKPGKVKVTSQHIFRGNKQGEPETYTFMITTKNNSENTLAATKAILEKKETNNDSQDEEIFSDSIGLTVEASEERANKNNLSGIVNEEDIMVKNIDNQINKDLDTKKMSLIKDNVLEQKIKRVLL